MGNSTAWWHAALITLTPQHSYLCLCYRQVYSPTVSPPITRSPCPDLSVSWERQWPPSFYFSSFFGALENLLFSDSED